jgi:hypothetical protein
MTNVVDIAREEMARLFDALRTIPAFIPTGIIEPAIEAVGNVSGTTIINLQLANKVGKTTGAVNILREIVWPMGSEYFQHPMFKEWAFRDVDGAIIKRGRIVGTKENIAEVGPINTEIAKWWPRGKYEIRKLSHSYPKEFKTDSGWLVDVMSHEQDPKEHEGPLLSWCWVDEPAKPAILGAILRRFQKGGVLLLTQTPINAGPMLDILDDLQAQGSRIITITGTIWDNDIETGKPNSKGTRRGLMTKAEIESYVANTPDMEREAALFGRASHKSGKIYPTFDKAIHVRNYDLLSSYAQSWNTYMVMDPHRAYYPFMMWLAVTPEEDVVVFNEWPTYKGMHNNFYDQIRLKEHYYGTIDNQVDVIRLLDCTEIGLAPITKRFIDPRFARGTQNEWTKDTQGIVAEFMKPSRNIKFEMPPFELIDKQRVVIQELLRYGHSPKLEPPRFFVLPHCANTIRAFERHYYEESSENEAEDYKDALDCVRYFLAGIGQIVYKERKIILPSQKERSRDVVKTVAAKDKLIDEMRDISR